MTSLIIRILFVILVVWILRWFLGLFTARRRPASGPTPSRQSENMVKDPVCGMYMDPRVAIKHESKNGVFYFCSEKCREEFLKIPPEKR